MNTMCDIDIKTSEFNTNLRFKDKLLKEDAHVGPQFR